MEIGQMNAIPILVVIAVIIYFMMRRTPNKPEEGAAREVKSHEPTMTKKETPKETNWVSTNSRLPELYKEVTIFTTDKETLHGWARVNDWDYIHSKDDRTINNVTHWMDIGSPNTEMTTPGKKDPVQQTSQIAQNKPHMPR